MKLSSQAGTVTLAGEHSSEMPVFQRSPLIKVVKSLLVSAQSFFPRRCTSQCMNSLFAFTRECCGCRYSRHVLYQSIFGSHAGRMRAKLVHSVMPYSLVGSSGLEATYDAATAVIAGQFQEISSSAAWRREDVRRSWRWWRRQDPSRRRMWLFDSFQGIPDPTAEDFDEKKAVTGEHIRPLVRGSCLGTKSEVESVSLFQVRLSRDSVCLVEGWFQDTLPVYRDRIGPIAVLRLDGDWYESTLCCLHNLYDQCIPGWIRHYR